MATVTIKTNSGEVITVFEDQDISNFSDKLKTSLFLIDVKRSITKARKQEDKQEKEIAKTISGNKNALSILSSVPLKRRYWLAKKMVDFKRDFGDFPKILSEKELEKLGKSGPHSSISEKYEDDLSSFNHSYRRAIMGID